MWKGHNGSQYDWDASYTLPHRPIPLLLVNFNYKNNELHVL